MESSNSNYSDKFWEIMGDDLQKTVYLKAGINRLLYPQKYIHKGIVKVEEDSFILDNDKQDEMVLSFCELIFAHYAVIYLIDKIFKNIQDRIIPDIFDVIKRQFYHIRIHRYSTFHEVHKFLLRFGKTNRARILYLFQFSNRTIIELLELLDEDYINYYTQNKFIGDSNYHITTEDEKFEFDNKLLKNLIRSEFNNNGEYNIIEKDHDDYIDCSEWYSEDSHRRFEELIKRENYPPLFFAVLVYNYISKTTTRLDLVDFAFTDEDSFKLATLSIWHVDMKHGESSFDLQEFVKNNHPFSDSKFTEWVDEWIENFDSFVKEGDLLKWIDYESDESNEDCYDDDLTLEISEFLLTRGWEDPGFERLMDDEDFIWIKKIFKEYVGDELKRKAVMFSIIQNFIPDEDRAAINWWLSKTHYYTIFNKLVEYYTAKYLDKGQEQIPLQKAESSAAKKSNDDEQQNIPIIIIDKDEAHKEWFVRVHEKKINAQPDEWNKKLYTCLDALYESLVKKGLMCESSKKELFIYRFSGFNIPESFNPLEKIRWEGSNVLLGYLVRCLITYTGSDAKGLGTVGTFFESKRGNEVNLGTAKYISKENFNQTPNMYPVLSLAVEILKECGFEEVEATSTRKRDK